MEILIVVAVLQLLLFISVASAARSYFSRGRHRGMQEAAIEIVRGVKFYFEGGEQLPWAVSRALEKLKVAPGHASPRKELELRHAQLWVLGDAMGSACWSKACLSAKQAIAPRNGNILVELSASELLHLNWLAHLGFQQMMPNYRDFETHRFEGEDDARDSAKAVERLETYIPAMHRPADPIALSNSRLALIENWWSARKLTAA